MDEFKVEKLLALFYPAIIGLSFIASVSSAVSWNHWKYVLDTCVETNCGCILNSKGTLSVFTGGHVGYCHWMVYGPLLCIFFAVIFGLYHVYRVCMGKNKSRTGATHVRQRSGEMIVMTMQTEMSDNEVSPYYWIPASITAVIMSIYTLVHASMFIDGYYSTCKEYRNILVKVINAVGNLVGAIQGRLSCAAVFDLMDYLHSDTADIPYERRRDGKINTAASLIIALISSWLCVFLWIAIAVLSIRQVRASRNVRV